MNISHSSATQSPFARNHAALAAPILRKLEVSTVEAVFGWTKAQCVAWDVARDTANLAAAEASYAYACAQLGVANRSRKIMRRQRVAAAFRYLNQRRAAMCAARKALAASIAAQAAPFAIGRQHTLPLA